ncbi:endonuclease V, partial [Bacillus spizizenii]|nr:endonuclease V [Bacillus spizizenii]
MKVHQIHDFHLKDESDFVQTQQSLKHKINLSSSITPDSINTC